MIQFNNPLLVIGHPGHELRAFKFIKTYKPDVIILTDGSGSQQSSRMANSVKILSSLGARYINLFTPFTDKELYDHILNLNFSGLEKIRNLILKQTLDQGYDLLIGDALEGFNPTHDLCRYIINSTIKKLNTQNNTTLIQNIAYKLDGNPTQKNAVSSSHDFFNFQLNENEFDEKYSAALNYPELQYEVNKAIELYGKQAFMNEEYELINDPCVISNWHTTYPYYEKYGKEKVQSGTYQNVIQFDAHMKPIALRLLES